MGQPWGNDMALLPIPPKHHEESRQVIGEINRVVEEYRNLLNALETSGLVPDNLGRQVMDLAERHEALSSRLVAMSKDI